MKSSRSRDRRATAVSVTPAALERDSRTFREAASLAAAGFRSLVFEGRRSGFDRKGLPFTLLPASDSTDEETPDRGAGQPRRDRPRSGIRDLWHVLRRRRNAAPLDVLVFAAYVIHYLVAWVIVPVLRLPRGDVYILHEFSMFPAVWIRARIVGAPIIYDVHDFYSRIRALEEQTPLERRWIGPFHRRIERACVRHARAVLTVSPGLAADFAEDFGVEPAVVRNFHDHRLDRPPRQGLRRRLGLGEAETLLVTVGQFKAGMAIDSLLDAVARLPGTVHWALIGDGYDEIRDRVVSHGLAERVHLVGAVLPYEIVPFLADADIGVVIYYARSDNYRYALPNGFFQTVAAGLATIYPPLPEMARLMRERGLGLEADPTSPEQLAAAVKRIIADPDCAGTAAARRELAREFSWDREERLFLDVVRSVCRQSRSPRR